MVTMEAKKEAKDLIENRDGVCSPEAYVEFAEPETSPIHDAFTWDDSEAGRKYRLWEARQMLAVIVEYYKDQQGTPKSVIAIVEVGGEKVEKRGYVSFQRAMETPNYYRQVLDEAIRNIRKWQTDYKQLTELHKAVIVNEEELLKVEDTLKK